MKQDWHPDELTRFWTLTPEERELLGNKTGTTRLGFAVLLKAFQLNGRFLERREHVASAVVAHLAHQVDVLPELYFEVDERERTQRHQRAQVREFCGFRAFRVEDEPQFVMWVSERVTTLHADAETLKVAAHAHLRETQVEPPSPDRLRRLLHTAVRLREERLVAETAARLTPDTRAALDRLVQTDVSEDEVGQVSLFPVRSELANLKEDAGAVKVETVLEEIRKLKQLRALGLPDDLFRDTPPKLVTHLRQRGASEKPKELRRHPPKVRFTLLAALCWQRSREITDNLVELLIHIAHRMGVKAEEKVEVELTKYAKKVLGKGKLLYKLAKAAKGKPDGTVKDVIFTVVGEAKLDDIIREAEADAGYERQVRLVTRKSYGHHYRRIVPALLEVLSFGCNNERHRPVMEALALLEKYRGRKTAVFPAEEEVPLVGVVKDDWQDLVLDDRQGGRVNRISYELCFLSTLREKVRCKEVWVEGASRYRNPDEDLPQDFDQKRDEYYDALEQPKKPEVFVANLRQRMKDASPCRRRAPYLKGRTS